MSPTWLSTSLATWFAVSLGCGSSGPLERAARRERVEDGSRPAARPEQHPIEVALTAGFIDPPRRHETLRLEAPTTATVAAASIDVKEGALLLRWDGDDAELVLDEGLASIKGGQFATVKVTGGSLRLAGTDILGATTVSSGTLSSEASTFRGPLTAAGGSSVAMVGGAAALGIVVRSSVFEAQVARIGGDVVVIGGTADLRQVELRGSVHAAGEAAVGLRDSEVMGGPIAVAAFDGARVQVHGSTVTGSRWSLFAGCGHGARILDRASRLEGEAVRCP